MGVSGRAETLHTCWKSRIEIRYLGCLRKPRSELSKMSVAGEVLNGVGLWVTRQERRQERDDAAVRSVLAALNATKRYLASRDRGEPVDRQVEAGLVDLWTTASVHIRRTDAQLAVRLQRKAAYWTNPENWTPKEVVANRIQIDQIAEEGKRLLGDV